MEKSNLPTIEITVKSHIMTKEEIQQSKMERKQREKDYRKKKKETRKKAKQLKKNYKTMEQCMVHPSNIKVGSLEKCIYSRIIEDFYFMGSGIAHVEEKYEPIEGEKVFVRIIPNFDAYFDLDEINSNKDLREIGSKICLDGAIILYGKVLECCSGEIRINRKTLHSHPYFKENNIDTPISIKQLKKIVEEYRK